MSKKWTIPNAVKKFTPHQKVSLKRNKGNLNKHEFNSLIKEMNCYYELVMVEGKGKERIIYTDKKRKVKAQKEDKRQFNKGIAPPHSKHLALMIMSKIDKIDSKARTRNGWATYFGLISSAERDIMNGIYSEEALKPYKALMIRLGIIKEHEEKIFQDLAYTLSKVAKLQLQTVLDQAEKMNLISKVSSWKGKVKYSEEPLDVGDDLAMQINLNEAKLLKKHGISKVYSIIIKNCPKTKAFKADWLQYIENVEDGEGDAMHLQYIYEVFRIKVLNKHAFDVYTKAHYSAEIDSFQLLENEQAYNSKLLDYVIEDAKKKHEKRLESESKKLTIDKDTKEILAMFSMTEDEAIAQMEEEEVWRELSAYDALLKSDQYIDCIRNLHIHLHSMSAIESKEAKVVQYMLDEHRRKELIRIGLLSPTEVESKKSVKNEIFRYDESSINIINQQEELSRKEQTKKNQVDQGLKEVALETPEQQGITTVDKLSVEPSRHDNAKEYYAYQVSITDIEGEIQKNKNEGHVALDTVIRELTREVSVEKMITEFTHQLQCEKEKERKEWDKLFEREQRVKRELTTNNPLEVFHRIRRSSI
ncbi:hypothetical protein [Priestia aryabhattai]|uniref:hypothetical protein n=1 Tax=Priestia aryabhattai TaxID=412384 RepID=UPI003D2980A5